MKHFSLLTSLALLAFTACENPAPVANPQPKNVILMVGDGMGVSQLSSVLYASDQPLALEQFPVVGLSKTSSYSHKITDSAAGAAAFSFGQKTYNKAIGMDKDSLPAETLLETLHAQGWKTGLVATSSITHATPASFFAHVKFRKYEEEIATYLHRSGVDYFVGGGINYFNQRKDSLNYLDSLRAQGYHLVLDALPTAEEWKNEKLGCLIGALEMPPMLSGRGDILGKASIQLLQRIKGEKPFFVMIEGSQIDWGGHENQADYLIAEMLDFNATIAQVLEFAKADGETLVIVTADHETGGFAIGSNEGKYNEIEYQFTTGHHTGAMVPVFAYGPGAEKFSGIYENTEIYHKIKQLIGF
ncbi:alkaline phosphatase [Cytophagales bacterium LB-30]|uniref:Alkaline phosphatase n=1 Tax=Shiella aurantiaca TaxID=3058365 RepID=A0ABT8F8C3_9BACT|nr:alkaline phosphatase [Shiella aurantiaca]MDN4166732.1 alkaline phosphatase [Shiella aurantiaca]